LILHWEKAKRKKNDRYDSLPLSPKALNNNVMAGLLTYSPIGMPSRRVTRQWPKDNPGVKRAYSSGTVRDFHPVPF